MKGSDAAATLSAERKAASSMCMLPSPRAGYANRLLAWGFPFDPSIRMRLMLDYYYYRSPHE